MSFGDLSFADLDAVTIDGYGTLLELVDPVERLRQALSEHGLHRSSEQVAAAFRAEAAYYRPRAHLGRDQGSLAALRRECVAVFLERLAAPLEVERFLEPFLSALVFRLVPGAVPVLERLFCRGVPLAVVANWDCALEEHLDRLQLRRFFRTVVTSARAGEPKPAPAPFRLALRELGVEPSRALHVGDEAVDEQGARATGMRFAPAPLARVFRDWP
jgi:putative hydrolase of the HAD superfamily